MAARSRERERVRQPSGGEQGLRRPRLPWEAVSAACASTLPSIAPRMPLDACTVSACVEGGDAQ